MVSGFDVAAGIALIVDPLVDLSGGEICRNARAAQ
jgi:hypothetical protein